MDGNVIFRRRSHLKRVYGPSPLKKNRMGERHGHLVVIGKINSQGERSRWRVRCDCGKTKIVRSDSLFYKYPTPRSCGCIGLKKLIARATRHGKSKSPIYKIWAAMISRCHRKSDAGYIWYGARGIKVCKSWRKFDNFYADMGDRPDGLSLDRIDNNGNYESGNCRWATLAQQIANKRRHGRYTYKKKRNLK